MKCLDCGEIFNASTAIYGDERHPEPGDISVCVYCGHLMGLDVDGSLRALTSAEMHRIAGDPRILSIQKARAEFIEAEKAAALDKDAEK